jgi:hypothetical protein
VESSFGAVTGLLISILLLVTVRYMERQERERQRAAVPPTPVIPAPGRGPPSRSPEERADHGQAVKPFVRSGRW